MICYTLLLAGITLPSIFSHSPEDSTREPSFVLHMGEEREIDRLAFRSKVAPEQTVPFRQEVLEDSDCDALRSFYLRTVFGLTLLGLVALVIVSYVH